MIQANGKITELWLSPGGLVGGRIACSPVIDPAPGQYLLGRSDEPGECLPSALFVYPDEEGSLLAAPPLPQSWRVGTRLSLRGPCGKGFRVPAGAQKVALAALDGNPYRLMPLIHQALARHAGVTLYSRSIPRQLPVAVEILPLDMLPDALNWADFLAVEISMSDLALLHACLGAPAGQHCPCPTQVLVATPMPCGGVAECGVCSVHTRKGWQLACTDGPVFDFDQMVLP